MPKVPLVFSLIAHHWRESCVSTFISIYVNKVNVDLYICINITYYLLFRRSISRTMHQFALLVLFVAILEFSHGCYITNCPIGGKRSSDLDNDSYKHQVWYQRNVFFSVKYSFFLNLVSTLWIGWSMFWSIDLLQWLRLSHRSSIWCSSMFQGKS